jgi:hypothetical protein
MKILLLSISPNNILPEHYLQISKLHRQNGIFWGWFKIVLHEKPKSQVVLAIIQNKVVGWGANCPTPFKSLGNDALCQTLFPT